MSLSPKPSMPQLFEEDTEGISEDFSPILEDEENSKRMIKLNESRHS